MRIAIMTRFLSRGRVSNGKGPGNVAVKIYRVPEGEIGAFPSLEFVMGAIGVNPQCHRILSDSLPIHVCPRSELAGTLVGGRWIPIR